MIVVLTLFDVKYLGLTMKVGQVWDLPYAVAVGVVRDVLDAHSSPLWYQSAQVNDVLFIPMLFTHTRTPIHTHTHTHAHHHHHRHHHIYNPY